MRASHLTVVLSLSALALGACGDNAHDPLAPDMASVDAAGTTAVMTPALPFQGSVEASETHFISQQGVFQGHVTGTGTATQLGRFTLEDEQVGSVATLSAAVNIVLRAANGDVITAAGSAQATPAPDFLSLTQVETVTITGGTGRFAGASGSFVLERVIDIAAGSPYPSTGSIRGTITLAL